MDMIHYVTSRYSMGMVMYTKNNHINTMGIVVSNQVEEHHGYEYKLCKHAI